MIQSSLRSAIHRTAAFIAIAALSVRIGLAAAAPVSPHALTPRRFVASVCVLLALTGAIVGWRALKRKAWRGTIAALVLGPIAAAGGALVVATANGGLGTGNGLAGGFVAMLVGLIGMTLGGLALARNRRTL